MPLALQKRCSGETHRIEIHRDGTINLRAHDVNTLKAFTAFGAKKPRCLTVVEDWEDDPIRMLLAPGILTNKEVALIAIEWASQVAPLAWEDPFESGVDRSEVRKCLRDALRDVRSFWLDTPAFAPFQIESRLEKSVNIHEPRLINIKMEAPGSPGKQAIAATQKALEAAWFAYRAGGGDPMALSTALAYAMNAAEAAKDAVSSRVAMFVTDRLPEYVVKIKEKTFRDAEARQVYAAIKIIEEQRG
jgi:hypothetical protein